MKIKNVVKHYK